MLGGARRDDSAACVAAFRPQIDDMIRTFDDVQIVLDDDDGIALFTQPRDDIHQLFHVVRMQAGGGLIQNKERLSRLPAGEIGRQLDALGFAARKRRGRLAKLDIRQPHILEHLQNRLNLGDVFEKLIGIFHGHIQHFKDVLALVFDLQRLSGIPLSFADFAGDIHIRQKAHADLDDAIALAGLAAPALDVEGEAALGISAHFGVVCHGEKIPDMVEHAGIRRRVGSGRAADGGLIDVDDLIDMLQPQNLLVFARAVFGAVQLPGRRLVENLVDQRGFTAAGYAGYRGNQPDGELDVDIFQVILRRALDLDIPVGRLFALFWNLDLPPA